MTCYASSVSAEDGDDGAAVVAGLLGVGLGALVTAALVSRPAPREMFERRLRERLAGRGVELAAANLARGPGAPVWILTLRLPAGLMTVQAPLPADADPLALPLADEVASRVAAYLMPYGAKVA